ncbi:MAG: hypothetical protein RLZZ537_433, partial [Pseudomonadota bacterium]
MNLNEVRAVVTGGVSGLGFAVAQHIIAHGGKVALFDINSLKATEAITCEKETCESLITQVFQ